MIRRKLNLIFKTDCVKYLSTVSSPKIDYNLLETSPKAEVLQSPDYFKVHNLFTVKDLFDAKVHYGHKDVSIKRNMKPFVFGSRLGHIIFDLDITSYHLIKALNATAHIAYRNGVVLFISKNPRMTLLVENTAKECKEYAVTREWILGTFTNLSNRNPYMRLPDLCILLNTLRENGSQHPAVVEAAKMSIPTIGIVDSNCEPNLISYPVPGSDDSFSCFQLYCKLFKEAILRGKNERSKHLKEISEAEESDNAKAVKSNKEDTSIVGELKNFEVEKNE